MQPYTRLLSVLTLTAGMGVGAMAMAADPPKEGTFKLHSDYRATVQIVEAGEKHIMGSGTLWGVTYNDAGSGPLHMGAWFCAYSFENVNGPANDGGSCAFGDAGGANKILVAYTGKGDGAGGDQGTGTIIGGVGKYAGIQGKMVWQCHPIEAAQGMSACTQQFDYQLKQETASK